jgi:hypothetical protein
VSDFARYATLQAWTVGGPIPDRGAAGLYMALNPQVTHVRGLSFPALAGRPPDRDQSRSPRVAVVACGRVAPPARQIGIPHGKQ